MRLIYFNILLLIIINGCQPSKNYEGKKDLIGDWEGQIVDISNISDRISFPIYKYGYANFTLNEDSTYSYLMETISDVVIEKEVFGFPYPQTILKSGYKNFKMGYYLASSNRITLFDANRIKLKEYTYYFKNSTLYLEFNDKSDKQWVITWEK